MMLDRHRSHSHRLEPASSVVRSRPCSGLPLTRHVFCPCPSGTSLPRSPLGSNFQNARLLMPPAILTRCENTTSPGPSPGL